MSSNHIGISWGWMSSSAGSGISFGWMPSSAGSGIVSALIVLLRSFVGCGKVGEMKPANRAERSNNGVTESGDGSLDVLAEVKKQGKREQEMKFEEKQEVTFEGNKELKSKGKEKQELKSVEEKQELNTVKEKQELNNVEEEHRLDTTSFSQKKHPKTFKNASVPESAGLFHAEIRYEVAESSRGVHPCAVDEFEYDFTGGNPFNWDLQPFTVDQGGQAGPVDPLGGVAAQKSNVAESKAGAQMCHRAATVFEMLGVQEPAEEVENESSGSLAASQGSGSACGADWGDSAGFALDEEMLMPVGRLDEAGRLARRVPMTYREIAARDTAIMSGNEVFVDGGRVLGVPPVLPGAVFAVAERLTAANILSWGDLESVVGRGVLESDGDSEKGVHSLGGANSMRSANTTGSVNSVKSANTSGSITSIKSVTSIATTPTLASGSSLSVNASQTANKSAVRIPLKSTNGLATLKRCKVIQSAQSPPGAFVCSICHASFKVKSYRTRHMKKHRAEKPYKCPFYASEPGADSESDSSAETTPCATSDHAEHKKRRLGTKCHPTGGFSRRDTFKTHLRALHFIYPTGTKSGNRSHVSGRCAGCFKEFKNNDEWLCKHIETNQCPAMVRKYK